MFRPDRADYRVVGLYLGRVLIGVGLLLLVPAVFGMLIGEPQPALQFLFAAGVTLTVGLIAEQRLRTSQALTHSQGMVVAGLAWLVAPLFGALPLFLSGHYAGFLDAYFDAMSGFATAGLSVINDLDHVPDSLNLWRHLMQYVGGQGLVLAILVLFAPAGGATTMYVGEAREERILPNVLNTARFIGLVSLGWLVVLTPALAFVLAAEGLPAGDATFHAVNLFMAAFSTGGFAPMTGSVAFYHSGWLEAVLAIAMLGGATSFGVHYLLLRRRYAAAARHIEVRTFALALLGVATIAMIGLARSGAYDSWGSLLRRGGFYVLSAQTTTGFATLPARTLVTDWATLAPGMVVTSMMVGAMSGSTGGGIKVIRFGLAYKALKQQLRRVMQPSSALVVESYHAGKRQIVRPEMVQPALTILLAFLTLYALGALVGMFYGYPFDQAFFESVSAGATVGLSVGLTGPSLPVGLKVAYILQMWMGRLELIAVFSVFGFLWSTVRGRV